MSVTVDPITLSHAVVEQRRGAVHPTRPVTTSPQAPDAFRVVALAVSAADAWQVAHLLRALGRPDFHYSVRPAGVARPCARGLPDCEHCRTGRFRDDGAVP